MITILEMIFWFLLITIVGCISIGFGIITLIVVLAIALVIAFIELILYIVDSILRKTS